MSVNYKVKRLLQYRFCLNQLKELGFETVFSYTIGEEAGVSAEQVRKDFSHFGIKGNKKAGYVINDLLVKLNELFKHQEQQEIIIVGMGNIGHALSKYNERFNKRNMNIYAAFDVNPKKMRKGSVIPVYDIGKMPEIISLKNIKTAIIAVPGVKAQQICDDLVDKGIKGILNFAPVVLKAPKGITVNNINLSNELESILYSLKDEKKKLEEK